jgi:hypothetical protein
MIQLCEIIQADAEATDTDPSRQDIMSLLTHSRVCFETIMRLYYLRHGFEAADSYFTHDLAILAFIAQANLKALPSPTPNPDSAHTETPSTTSPTISRPLSDLDDIRATLFLAAKGLHSQGKSYQLPLTLFHVVQSMRPEEADMMHRYADIKPESTAAGGFREEHARSQYPVYIVDTEGHLGKDLLGGMVARLRERGEADGGKGDAMEGMIGEGSTGSGGSAR